MYYKLRQLIPRCVDRVARINGDVLLGVGSGRAYVGGLQNDAPCDAMT